MTQLDVIRMIGDVLTGIDVAAGSLMPDDPNLVRLQDQRRLLDARQLILSRQLFDENTARFQSAAADLSAVNEQIRGRLGRIEDMIGVLHDVARFLDAVTRFMTAIHAFG
jgi:hypothetical protein